jgi:hypothetical protein
VTSEAISRGVSSVSHHQRALSVVAGASEVLPVGEKQIRRFRTVESNPVSIFYFLV